ncbi:Phospholipase A1-II 4 [Linum perenne]
MGSIAVNWKKLSGQDNWEGLTDPLDPDFRRYLIHYGERLQAVYDAFNGETLSKAYGYSRYPPEDFFTSVFLQNGKPYKYQITKFFYASSEFTLGDWINAGGSAWMGYVAVSTEEGKSILGRRDIMVLSEVRRLVDKYRDEETSITVVGHSLGASLATLNATDIAANNYNKPTGSTTGCLVTAFVYASPLVGDLGFHNMFNSLTDLRLLRIRNFPDPVPTVPPKLFGFFEVGHEIMIFILSPYLKPLLNPHNLELYMHGVAGYNGLAGFKLVVERDIALINKGEDHLKDEYNVPPKWWNVKHKAMYQLDDGSWGMRDYIPPPPEDVVLL